MIVDFQQFDIGCQDWKKALAGTVHNVGFVFALPVIAIISDRYGRKSALMISIVSTVIVGVARSFTWSYNLFLITECLESIAGSGIYTSGFILALEIVGQNRRVLGGNLIAVGYAIGYVALALFAWLFPYWKTLLQVSYASAIFIVISSFYIDESVRWLLSKGRKDEAFAIITKMASINGTTISRDTKQFLDKDLIEDITAGEENNESIFKQVIGSSTLVLRALICSFWWVTGTFVYYGLSINSVSLNGNSYVNYALSGIVEIPGYFLSILTLDRYGRKKSIFVAFTICGLCCISLALLPGDLSTLITILYLLGKMLISMTFNNIYIYTSEIFPTTARHSLLAFCSVVGRVGSVSAPLTPLMMAYMTSLPSLLFGGMAIVAGLLMLLTPETHRSSLPGTVQQSVDGGRTRK